MSFKRYPEQVALNVRSHAEKQAARVRSLPPIRDLSKKYPKLRKYLLDLQEDSTRQLSRTEFKDILLSRYPELYAEVKVHQGVDLGRVFRLMGLYKPCSYCKQFANIDKRVRFRKFCSRSCRASHYMHSKSSFSTKTFVDKNGRFHKFQASEGRVLEYLDRSKKISQFTTMQGTELLPSIQYKVPGEDRRSWYMPDVGALTVDGRRLLIEVKSPYYLRLDLEKNRAKFRTTRAYAKEHGMEFWLVLQVKDKDLWIRDAKFLGRHLRFH